MKLKKYEQPNFKIKICYCDAILSSTVQDDSISTVKDEWDELGDNLY